MADSVSESCFQYLSSSLFSIPGFLVGFGNKSLPESESLRSPTSPLDFKFFSGLSSPFSLRSHLSSESENRKKFDSCEVGLAIINSLFDELVPKSGIIDSPTRKNVIFGPQVKTKILTTSKRKKKSIDFSIKSNSLPNYEIPSLSDPKLPNSLASSKTVIDYGLNFENEMDKDTTLIVSEIIDRVVSGCSRGVNLLTIKSTSLPIDIDSNHVGSLSAKEMELSEDYTCIISHGPNPKTTHIFGDCILECHTNELQFSITEENLGIESLQEAKCSEEDEEEDILMYSSDEFLSGGENEKTRDNLSGIFSGSSSQEDLYVLGVPIAL